MVNGACPLTETLTNGPGSLFKHLRYDQILLILISSRKSSRVEEIGSNSQLISSILFSILNF